MPDTSCGKQKLMGDIHIDYRVPDDSISGTRLQEVSDNTGFTVTRICQHIVKIVLGETKGQFLGDIGEVEGEISIQKFREMQHQIDQLQQQLVMANQLISQMGLQSPVINSNSSVPLIRAKAEEEQPIRRERVASPIRPSHPPPLKEEDVQSVPVPAKPLTFEEMTEKATKNSDRFG